MKIYYSKSKNDFSKELRKEVNEYFKRYDLPRSSNRFTKVSSLLLLILFIAIAAGLSFKIPAIYYYLLTALLGTLTLPLVLNIGHDAIHNTFFERREANNFAQNIFLLLGTSPYFWKLRHIHSHHSFSNVPGYDMDIEQTEIVRLNNHHEHKSHHSYQVWYMPFVFCFYTLNWFLYRDFKDLRTSQFGGKQGVKHSLKQYLILFASKALLLTYLIVLPMVFAEISFGQAIIGFLVFHFAASVVTTFALVSTHVGTQQEFVSLEGNQLPYSFDEHQLRTTSDFATPNRFLTWFYGGFNHHVAHHLFPGISQCHYRHITPIIREKCAQFDMPYHSCQSLRESVKEHFKLLKQNSRDNNSLEIKNSH